MNTTSSPWTILCICLLTAAFDGFDNESLAFVATSLVHDWGLHVSALGVVFTIGLAGLIVGSLVIAPFADRFGRKQLMVLAALWVASATFATSLANTIPHLAAIRFLTGIGLGALIPLVVTVSHEAAPLGLRSTFVTVIMAGFPAGSAVGAMITAWTLPRYGWAVLYVGMSVAGLIIALAGALGLPRDARASSGPRLSAPPILPLLRGSNAALTPLLWLLFITALIVAYLLASWLPSLLQREGFSAAQAVMAKGYFSMGGIVGAIALSFFIARYGEIVLVLSYSCAAAGIFAFAFVGGSETLLFGLNMAVGFLVYGGYACANALAAALYSLETRATGVGWAQGIGRVGAFGAPALVGIALQHDWTNFAIFVLMTVTTLVGVAIAISILLLKRDIAIGSASKA